MISTTATPRIGGGSTFDDILASVQAGIDVFRNKTGGSADVGGPSGASGYNAPPPAAPAGGGTDLLLLMFLLVVGIALVGE